MAGKVLSDVKKDRFEYLSMTLGSPMPLDVCVIFQRRTDIDKVEEGDENPVQQ